ncbi:unnamed protein product [Adineta ricciae]|uniref:PDZ domain-containing protein n=2 Tax=Adineta ricciae TaxID=249248 RepID=A0A813TX34_ADIRI|nr:unnamed protein product [Adineta ricciae]
MSTTNYPTQDATPTVTRRPLQMQENTGSASQRSGNRRSLSVKLRDLFRKDSSASNRPPNDQRSPTSPARHSSSSPVATSEATHFQTPRIPWPFGKKSKSSTTMNTSKTNKIKVKKEKGKIKQPTTATISSPVYEQENQSTSIYGQHFVPRSPNFEHSTNERMQTSTMYQPSTTTTAKGFRDYTVIDQTRYPQQVMVPDGDVFTPPTYTSDRSRSPSMSRQRQIDYHYQHERSTSPVSIPLPDIETMPTPSQKRKVDPISIEKPSTPKTTSSSILSNTGINRAASPSREVGVSKLRTPTVPFGSTSSKKKPKKSKSKSRADGKTSSSTTINNLIQQNPLGPSRSWTSAYGSLPDVELVSDNALKTTTKPSKQTNKEYPGLSAIVRHHQRPTTTYYNEYPPPIRTSDSHRPRRFETSTTTLNEYDQNQPWTQTPIYGSGPIISSTQRHDGYIRPLTPQIPILQADITITHVDLGDTHRQTPSIRPTYQQAPESPATYRSSTTVYTKDKHRYVDGGEIRTWSVQDNGNQNDYSTSYQKPYTYVEIDRNTTRQTANQYDHQIVPPKISNNLQEYRYSPRMHEREVYEKREIIAESRDHEFQEEEECYEVSFEYEREQPNYSYETSKYYDELHSANRYSSTSGIEKKAYTSLKSERDQIYDQTSRSYQRTQETRSTVSPVRGSSPLIRTCTLKRTDSYDGLGILISADSQTRLNHYIREVEPNSPGHLAGLRKNDRILSINGINVENVDFSNVLALIKQGLDNDNLQISVVDAPEHI